MRKILSAFLIVLFTVSFTNAGIMHGGVFGIDAYDPKFRTETVGTSYRGNTRSGIDAAIAAGAKSIELTGNIALAAHWDLSAFTGRFSTNGHQITGAFTFTASPDFAGSDICFGSTLTIAGLKVARPEWWSAITGSDDSTAIQSAINAASETKLVAGKIYYGKGITIPNNRTVWIDGTLKMPSASPAGSVILTNSDTVGGNSNITICGEGTIDGNKANQTGSTDAVWHTLILIDNCDYFTYDLRFATGNYFPNAIPSDKTTGSVYVKNSDYANIRRFAATDYGREALWLYHCNYSSVSNVNTLGGTDSWSGVQVSGDYNRAQNIQTKNSGASGMSFDVRYGSVNNVNVHTTSYFAGVNFGHSGLPADYTTASNITVDGAATQGVSAGGSTAGLRISNAVARNCGEYGFKVSDSATDIHITNSGAYGNTYGGLYAYQAIVWVDNFKASGNTTYGLVMGQAGTEVTNVFMSNSDLRDNTAGTISRTSATYCVEQFRNVRLSDDAMFVYVNVSGLGAGNMATVTNGNLTANSAVSISPSNTAGEVAGLFYNTKADGSVKIGTTNDGGSGAGAYLQIH